jgi:hypothetical protein
MANSTLSDLRQADHYSTEIEVLQKKLQAVFDQLNLLKKSNSRELSEFKISLLEKEKENRKRVKINLKLQDLRAKESKLYNHFLKSVNPKISGFLDSSQYGDFINQLLDQQLSINQESKLVSDPKLAKQLGLKDYSHGEAGQIRLNSGVKTFILDPQIVHEYLTDYLLQETLSA